MNGLYQFLEFNFSKFTDGKIYRSGQQSEWIDKESGELLGTKVPALIWQDSTPYKKTKKGKTISNQYEKVVFKVSKQITVPPNMQIKPVEPVVATVYGDYQNQLCYLIIGQATFFFEIERSMDDEIIFKKAHKRKNILLPIEMARERKTKK